MTPQPPQEVLPEWHLAFIDALPKIGEPENVWRMVDASHLREALRTITQVAADAQSLRERCALLERQLQEAMRQGDSSTQSEVK
jgi:hypothetical protein